MDMFSALLAGVSGGVSACACVYVLWVGGWVHVCMLACHAVSVSVSGCDVSACMKYEMTCINTDISLPLPIPTSSPPPAPPTLSPPPPVSR